MKSTRITRSIVSFLILACIIGALSCRNSKSNENKEVEEPVAVEAENIETSQMVDLGLSVKWAGYNVGASSPEQSGNYYAWGETSAKKEYSKETYTYFDKEARTFTNIGFNICGTELDIATTERAILGDCHQRQILKNS